MDSELSAQQIIDLVRAGVGPGDLFHGSTTSGDLAAQHDEVAGRMQRLQDKMSQCWKGDAAGQAYAGAGPLVQASKVSGQHLQQAGDLYNGQGNSYHTLKSKVQSAGNLGDRPSGDLVSGTWFSFLTNRADEIEKWDRKAQGVIDSYHAYHGESTDNSGRWASPSQYGDLSMPSGGGEFGPAQPDGGGQEHRPSVAAPGGHGSAGGVTGGTHSAGGHRGNPGDNGGHAGAPGGAPGVHAGSGPGVSGSGSHAPSAGTTSAGYVPPASTTGVGPGGWNSIGSQSGTGGGGLGLPGGFGPTGGNGGFGPPGGFGQTGGFGAVGGFGPTGGFGPGGAGGGSGSYGAGSGAVGGGSVGRGAGTGAGVGSGVGSGAGAVNDGVAARAGTPASGSGGRAGAPGMGGMGAGGKGGKGEGDQEHKTADYLLEADPDDALVGELPRAVPPVIGL
ncbi:hypothetical protein [Amycolatopsis panacis]|uniref:PPE domain-containing protein n=1 Tax=Amycolatopsis panacis TaxID=2340917 RepID=A0A419HJ60_9PSEU|nr:hypothetical protein [Amycolatopsis panacis]RJQ75843.1 hypothetical protein D5S19_30930 [Amycolatopsis panacis]